MGFVIKLKNNRTHIQHDRGKKKKTKGLMKRWGWREHIEIKCCQMEKDIRWEEMRKREKTYFILSSIFMIQNIFIYRYRFYYYLIEETINQTTFF